MSSKVHTASTWSGTINRDAEAADSRTLCSCCNPLFNTRVIQCIVLLREPPCVCLWSTLTWISLLYLLFLSYLLFQTGVMIFLKLLFVTLLHCWLHDMHESDSKKRGEENDIPERWEGYKLLLFSTFTLQCAVILQPQPPQSVSFDRSAQSFSCNFSISIIAGKMACRRHVYCWAQNKHHVICKSQWDSLRHWNVILCFVIWAV